MLLAATGNDAHKALLVLEQHQKHNQDPPELKNMDFYTVIGDMLTPERDTPNIE